MNTLKEQYRETWSFFCRDLRKPLLISVICLAAGILLGAVAGALNPDLITEAMGQFSKMVEEAGIVGSDGSVSMAGLLNNNWRAMLITVICGFVPFFFLPAFSLVSNGALLGLLATMYLGSEAGLTVYLAGILPHGIFELSALLISAACGIALCRNMQLIAISSHKRVPLVELLYDLLRVILLIIAPFTVAAAAIEAYVTPVIMNLFL